MFERILPSSIRVAERRLDERVPLFLEEEAAIARAAAVRRAEFVTVRACAREALAEMGVESVGIPPGAGGAPSWPAGVVGSMTHCAGFRAAAVASSSTWRSLGIDAEPREPLPEEVASLIASDAERQELTQARAQVNRGGRTQAGRTARTDGGGAADRRGTPWETVLFSAKESVYKAWYPLAGRFLDYPDVHVEVAADGSFTARLLVPGVVVGGALLDRFEGRWLVADDLVLTAVTVPRSR